MAVLQNIRNRAGLLIGIIAVALLAFLLGDFLNNGSLGRTNRTIAEINGEDIDIEEYQARVNELTEVYKMNSGQLTLDPTMTEQVQDNAWNALLSEYILEAEYDNTGIAVHPDELEDLVYGNNIHPLIRQLFANPQTGQVEKSQILSFLKSFDLEGGQERKDYWLFVEKEIIKQRKNEKYNNLLSKGILVNSEEAKLAIDAAKTEKNIDFFAVSYSTIPDSTVEVSSSDISSYYNKHKENYKQTESRSVEYVVYDIVASTEDDQEASEWSKEIAEELKDPKYNDENELTRYVKFNSDEAWDGRFLAKSELDENLQDFAYNSEIGAIYGPYKEDDTYKIVKLAGREMRADSVRASHILIQEESPERTEALADSLFNVLKANSSKMADLAKTFSKDPGSANNGGDLGWFSDGMMVANFNDAAFNGKVGEVQKVSTQYGTHLIIVNEKSKAVEKVQLASISRKVEPSNATYRNIYNEASQFRSASTDYESFKASAQEKGLRIRYGSNIARDSKTVMGLENSKDLVRWAYKAEKGDISDVIELDNYFVVATLTKIADKGYRPQSEVAAIIRQELIREKKGELISADINEKKASSQSITSLAAKMGTSIKTASNISFSSYSIPSAGVEPKLIGAIAVAEKDVISEPLVGNRGVYVFKVTDVNEKTEVPSIAEEKASIAQGRSYMVNYQAFNTLQEMADVKDMRLKFY